MQTDTKTLRDKFKRPIRDLRISIIDICNFRCPYCMPAEIFGADYNFLTKKQRLSSEEIIRLSRLFSEIGVSKLRITGGEPLIHPEVIHIVSELTRLPGIEDVALTTNASHLARRARGLKEAGLHRLTVSLDSLDEEVFQVMNGRKSSVAQVLNGIETAVSVGFQRIKLNCVVKKGVNDHTLLDLVRHFKGTGHIIRFIEYMDVGNLNGWKLDDVLTADEILDTIDAEFPIEAIPPNYKGEVATRYRFTDGSGEIGVIASVTKPFCGNCTRARISSAGEYYTCLFAVNGTDLRAPMREGASDEEMLQRITGVWQKRNDRYSEMRTSFTRLPAKGAEMYRIGG
ncbi:MAG: GTP 3',8-cyclase MoaA [Chloroflexota bacterium]